eukprot:14861048-Alexandrium_andersonii.AAC.1
MMVLSMAQTIGAPRGHDAILRELQALSAPWHSAVIADSTLDCVKIRCGPEFPEYKYCAATFDE